MKNIPWIITIIGSIIGVFFLSKGILTDGYPGAAANAAIAVGFVVIPYCFARSVSELEKKQE